MSVCTQDVEGFGVIAFLHRFYDRKNVETIQLAFASGEMTRKKLQQLNSAARMTGGVLGATDKIDPTYADGISFALIIEGYYEDSELQDILRIFLENLEFVVQRSAAPRDESVGRIVYAETEHH